MGQTALKVEHILGPGISHKYYIRLNRLARGKRLSFFIKKKKRFYDIDPLALGGIHKASYDYLTIIIVLGVPYLKVIMTF